MEQFIFSQVNDNKIGGAYSVILEMINEGNLYGKPERERLLRRFRLRLEDNIKTDLKVIEYEGVEWFHRT